MSRRPTSPGRWRKARRTLRRRCSSATSCTRLPTMALPVASTPAPARFTGKNGSTATSPLRPSTPTARSTCKAKTASPPCFAPPSPSNVLPRAGSTSALSHPTRSPTGQSIYGPRASCIGFRRSSSCVARGTRPAPKTSRRGYHWLAQDVFDLPRRFWYTRGMARVRCIFGWLLFLGFLMGVGAVCFIFVRHAPRCTITGPLVFKHLSGDGSRLVTLKPIANHFERGPLQVWNTHSGGVVHEWFADTDVLRFQRSADDRHGAIVLSDGRVRIVDWQTGQAWRFDEPPENEAVNRADFSSRGRWLFVVTASCSTLYLIDVNTCEVVLRTKDNWPVVSADDRLVFYRQGQ